MTVDAEEDIKTLNINSVTLDWLAVVMNLTLNIMATLLIFYRAWYIYILIYVTLGAYRIHWQDI